MDALDLSVAARFDAEGGKTDPRRLAAHAHVMSHHALELDTPDAHRAAAAAHQKVADTHEEAADELDEEEAPESE